MNAADSDNSPPKLSNYFSKSSASPFEDISEDKKTSMPSSNDGFFMADSESFLTSTADESLTAHVTIPELDQAYDAWIPSQLTADSLSSFASSPESYFPEKSLLTLPGITAKEEFVNPIHNLLVTYLGEQAASEYKCLTCDSVTQDDRGLRQLINAGCFHAALNLTTQLLTVYGQGEGSNGRSTKHTAHSIQLWFTRIALLVKLRRFSLAEIECEAFGDLDSPDLYFEFYPELYEGRKGSLVPFYFRLLVAELPKYLGKHTQTLDKLNTINKVCNQILRNLNSGLNEFGKAQDMDRKIRESSIEIWQQRRIKVLYSLTSCSVGLKDVGLAVGLIHRLLNEDSKNVCGLYSALGRLCLQLGDISAAQTAFERHLETSPSQPRHDPLPGMLHSAYIACAKNDFKDAVDILWQAHKIASHNAVVVNNLGVCLLYTGQVRDAMQVVQDAVYSNPRALVHEAVVLNLCTMYELESSKAHHKKLQLLQFIAKQKGDAFNVTALKLHNY